MDIILSSLLLTLNIFNPKTPVQSYKFKHYITDDKLTSETLERHISWNDKHFVNGNNAGKSNLLCDLLFGNLISNLQLCWNWKFHLFSRNFSLNLTICLFKKNLLKCFTWNFPYGSSTSCRVLLVDPRKEV